MIRLFSCELVGQLNDGSDGIGKLTLIHGIHIACPVVINLVHCVQQGLRGDLLLVQYIAVALPLELLGV